MQTPEWELNGVESSPDFHSRCRLSHRWGFCHCVASDELAAGVRGTESSQLGFRSWYHGERRSFSTTQQLEALAKRIFSRDDLSRGPSGTDSTASTPRCDSFHGWISAECNSWTCSCCCNARHRLTSPKAFACERFEERFRVHAAATNFPSGDWCSPLSFVLTWSMSFLSLWLASECCRSRLCPCDECCWTERHLWSWWTEPALGWSENSSLSRHGDHRCCVQRLTPMWLASPAIVIVAGSVDDKTMDWRHQSARHCIETWSIRLKRWKSCWVTWAHLCKTTTW